MGSIELGSGAFSEQMSSCNTSKKDDKKHRSYMLTINNFTQQDRDMFDKVKCEYYIYQIEVGANGTRHIQGLVHYKNPVVWPKRIWKGAHIEVANNLYKCINYCRKEDTRVEGPFSKGEEPMQGRRTDLESLAQDIYEGKKDLNDIGRECPMAIVKYSRGLQVLSELNKEKRNWEMDVRIYWGETGTGKTKAVYDEFGIDNVYVKMMGKWWDHYKGEKCVIIDDFDPLNAFQNSMDFYLKLTDRYPMWVEYKGGSCQFRSRVIIFTSNYNPDLWWEFVLNRSAFFRRVKFIKEFK